MPTETLTIEQYRQMEYKSMTEKQFQEIVRRELKAAGWLAHHNWLSIHSSDGFPDIVAVRGDRILIAELKSEKGKVSSKQEEWLRAFGQSVCIEVYVWRPSDLPTIWEVVK